MALTRIQMTTDFRPELARLDLPVLVVHGDADASAPIELTGRPAAALIPSAELCVYEGAGHGLYFTHQQRLNDDILRFVMGSRVDRERDMPIEGDGRFKPNGVTPWPATQGTPRVTSPG